MKAVLVIDLPVSEDEIRDVGFLANVHVFPSIASERQYEYENVVVRPLPKKSEMADDWRINDLKETESGLMARCYFKGRNEVIDEIVGKENEE